LGGVIDTLFHAAALVKFYGNYSDSEKVQGRVEYQTKNKTSKVYIANNNVNIEIQDDDTAVISYWGVHNGCEIIYFL
jgi:hypothetical protein